MQNVAQSALPFLIFIFTVSSFLKVDLETASRAWKRPAALALLLIWCLIGAPVVVAILMAWTDLSAPLWQAVMIWAVSPPMAAAIVFAMFLRLDVALAVAASLAGMILLPLTGSPMSVALARLPLDLDPLMLIARVTLFVGSAALIAALIRKAVGPRLLNRYSHEISGVIVVILVIYATSLMSGVRGYIFDHPWQAFGFILLAALLNALIQVMTAALFWRFGPFYAATAALLCGNKNMSVIYANLGSAITPEIMLFFAAIHVPIYTFPWLFKGVYEGVSSGRLPFALRSPAKAGEPKPSRTPSAFRTGGRP
jgi:hypothetical protein